MALAGRGSPPRLRKKRSVDAPRQASKAIQATASTRTEVSYRMSRNRGLEVPDATIPMDRADDAKQLSNHLAHRLALGIASRQVAPLCRTRAVVSEEDLAVAVPAFGDELFATEPRTKGLAPWLRIRPTRHNGW